MGLPGYAMLAMTLIITQATIAYGSKQPIFCPSNNCSPGCAPDFAQKIGLHICPPCVCPLCWPPCQTGYECKLVDVFCIFGFPCPPRQSQCVRKPCIDITCPAGCTKYDSIGCPYCECPTPTCETTICSPGYVCEMQFDRNLCLTLPCLGRPVCVPAACRGQPHRHICFPLFIYRYTYDHSQDLCQKFRYYFCFGSLNTFRNPNTCERLCEKQRGGLTDLSEVFASKLKEGECPQPQSCTIECSSGGLKTDESGCQICECLPVE